jgi:hypothetical protein
MVVLKSFLSPFINKRLLSFLQQIKKIINGKDQYQKEDNHVSSSIDLGTEISDPR